jgi:hypothetical protein
VAVEPSDAEGHDLSHVIRALDTSEQRPPLSNTWRRLLVDAHATTAHSW